MSEETEKCVGSGCNKDTGIPKNLAIDDPHRLECYVEGVGQLCPKCYDKIYGNTPINYGALLEKIH